MNDIKLYDLHELFNWDATFDKIFDYFDKHYDVVSYILSNKLTDYYYYIGMYPNLKPNDLIYVETIKQSKMVNGLLNNPNVSAAWLEQKSKSTEKSISLMTLRHKNLPIKIMDKIFKDPIKNKSEIAILLSNPSCPIEYLLKHFDTAEAQDINYEQPLLIAITKNENIPIEIFIKIIDNFSMDNPKVKNILKFSNMNKAKLDYLYLTYNTKSSDRDSLINHLSNNQFLSTNYDLQEFIVVFLYKDIDGFLRDAILKNLIPVANASSINAIYIKFVWIHLTKLLINKNTPTEIAWTILSNMLFRNYEISSDNLYDGFNFTDIQLTELLKDANKYQKRTINTIMKLYKDKLSASLLISLYDETNNEVFLPTEVKDIFLF